MNAESKGGFFSAVKSILAAFFGVQSEQTRQNDFSVGKPRHFIIAGLLITAILVVVIILLVKVAMRYMVV